MPVYKDSQRGTWYTKFRYTDWQGKRRETTKRGFATKREAKEYEENFLRTKKDNPDLTIGDLCKLYLEDLKTRTKERTYINLHTCLYRHVSCVFGMKVSDFTPTTCNKWKALLKEQKSATTHEPLKPQTIITIESYLSRVFNYGVKFHGVKSNPFHIAGYDKNQGSKAMAFYEETDFKKFIDAIPKKMRHDRLYFSILYTSGMRVGEFLALSESDFDFDSDTININKTFNDTTHAITSPKTTSSVRVITMPHKIMQEIHGYFRHFSPVPARVFPIRRDTLQRHNKIIAKLAGLKEIRLHDFRHSHASYLIHHGVPVTAIAARLGHSSPKITLDVYSHVYKESDTEIAKMINNSLL